MTREYWYALYRDVRSGIPGSPNLFPPDQRADIALEMALAERKARYREERNKRLSR